MFGKINDKDLKIISALRDNARMPLTKMSRKTQIPISTIHDRLKSYRDSLVKKYTSLLDFSALGYHTRAHMMMKTKKEKRLELKDYLTTHQNVNSVFKVNNGYDFLADLVFRNIREMEEFIEFLEASYDVKKREVYYIIDEVKREEFFSRQEMIGVLMQ